MDRISGLTALFILCLSLVGGELCAQYDADAYYTDNKVHKRIMGIGAHVQPFYNNRRLISNELNPGGTFVLLDETVEGSWQIGGGLDFYIGLGPNFEFISGVGVASYGFAYPQVQKAVVDTFYNCRLEESAQFLSFPLALSFRTDMGNGWWLEFIPAAELSWLRSYEALYKGTDSDFVLKEDLAAQANDFFLWGAVSVGGTYRPYGTWGYTIRAQGRYMFNSLIQKPDFPRETLYSVGLQLGIQYRF